MGALLLVATSLISISFIIIALFVLEPILAMHVCSSVVGAEICVLAVWPRQHFCVAREAILSVCVVSYCRKMSANVLAKRHFVKFLALNTSISSKDHAEFSILVSILIHIV